MAHPVAAARLLSLLEAEAGPVPATAASGTRTARLQPSSLHTFPIDLPQGRCAHVLAALEPGGSGLELRVFDPKANESFALVRGRVMAGSRVCASAQGASSLTGELRLSAGEADALVLTYLLAAPP